MKNLLLFGALALCLNSYGQSKKQQITALNYSMDSLNTVLSTTRDNASKDIGGLNSIIDSLNNVLTTTRDNAAKDIYELNSEIAQLKNDVSSLESSTTELTKENSRLTLELEEANGAAVENDAYRGTDGNIQPLKIFSEYYETINAWDLSYLKFQKYPLPNSKQNIIQWLKQFEISSETNVVYDYDVDPEDWKGVTGMYLTSYKNGIILQKLSGYEGISIRIEFPFLSVNDAKLLFKQFDLLELAPGCGGEEDLDINFKYSTETMGTTVYFSNGC